MVFPVDPDKLIPSGPEAQKVDRQTDGPIAFSVKNALTGSFNVYWFVEFDFKKPVKWESTGDPFLVYPCGEHLKGDFQKIVTVEALVTEGVLDISFVKEGDPRYTHDGEPIAYIRWTVVAEGVAPPTCPAEPPQ